MRGGVGVSRWCGVVTGASVRTGNDVVTHRCAWIIETHTVT